MVYKLVIKEKTVKQRKGIGRVGRGRGYNFKWGQWSEKCSLRKRHLDMF